ncbi:MAG: TIM44-like domain-containing protein [Pyrinomonadaceae bacterium]
MKRSRIAQFVARLSFLAAIATGVMLAFLLLSEEALARVGGGQSYGGGSGSGGGGGDGAAGAIIWLIFQIFRVLIYLTIEYPVVGIPLDIFVACGVAYYFVRRARRTEPATPLGLDTQQVRSQDIPRQFEQLRKFDPNFSEIVFTDFAYALYGKAHDARGHGAAALDQFSPYLSEVAGKDLAARNPSGLREVKGIIVGALNIENVRGLETPLVNVSLVFESNYTEVVAVDSRAPAEMSYYVRERWELERRRDVLSPPPAQATALHCPRCGAPLQKDTVGACAFCGTRVDSGEFQWYVRSITLLSRESKGPLLTSNVPEMGTDYPSVIQPNLQNNRTEFEKNNPSFSWGHFQARARLIFDELQAAWSTLAWERARPHETDNLFQMHQYWIDAYKRQHLRNVLDQCSVTAMQPVKITEDAFYNSITLRIGARGYDYTVDSSGGIVSGSKNHLRSWSEYWTFIRNRHAKPAAARADLNCPNCGAPLKVNTAGICEFCGGKITSGEFDWVLSKIEQDESYGG